MRSLAGSPRLIGRGEANGAGPIPGGDRGRFVAAEGPVPDVAAPGRRATGRRAIEPRVPSPVPSPAPVPAQPSRHRGGTGLAGGIQQAPRPAGGGVERRVARFPGHRAAGGRPGSALPAAILAATGVAPGSTASRTRAATIDGGGSSAPSVKSGPASLLWRLTRRPWLRAPPVSVGPPAAMRGTDAADARRACSTRRSQCDVLRRGPAGVIQPSPRATPALTAPLLPGNEATARFSLAPGRLRAGADSASPPVRRHSRRWCRRREPPGGRE